MTGSKLLLLVALLTAQPVQAGPGLPRAIDGWRLSKGPARYAGRKIYDYMDGAAEVHRMYGFRSLRVWTYTRGRKGRRPAARGAAATNIRVEVFDMGSAAGAFGDFTHARDIEGERVEVGQDGHYQSGVLWFWKGRFLVCVSSRAVKLGRQRLEPVARVAARVIKKEGRRPGLVGLLPATGLRKGTVRYFRRREALAYHYSAFKHGSVLELTKGAEAALADYKHKGAASVLLILRYPTAGRAVEVQRRLSRVVKAEAHKDAEGKWRGRRRSGRVLRLVLEAPTKTEVRRLLR